MSRSLPLLLLGIILASYWARVLRMAYKMRRRAGHSANFVPGEKIGRFIRIIWIPVVGLWVALPFITALVHEPSFPLRPIFWSYAIAWPAVVVAGACLVLSRICWKKMGRDWRMGIDPAEKNPLIATGPFAHVRHPIYALSALMMLATMAAVASPIMLGIGVVHLLLLTWEARREERHMLRVHGEDYARYQRAVGRFIPRLRHT